MTKNIRSWLVRGSLSLCTLAFVLLGALHAEGATQGAQHFDIPAQNTSDALNVFSKQSGMRLLFSFDAVEGMKAPAVSGTFTPEQALEKLLAGTGLHYQVTADRVVVIRGTEAEGGKTVSSGDADSSNMRLAQAGEKTASPEAAAASTEASLGKLEEVVVTAQKRKERLQDVPISIEVLSGADLDRSSVRSVADVLNRVGGVMMVEYGPGSTQIAIRGVVPDSQAVGASPAGYYLDEAPLVGINGALVPDVNAFDLARIEVLRGPQGTLYGVNAIAGVVRVLTNDADLNDFGGTARARASETSGRGAGNYSGDIALNVPLIAGKLAVRGVASYSDLSGYIDSSLSGKKRVNDSQLQFYRLKFNYQPVDDLNIKLGISRSDISNGPQARAFNDFTIPFTGAAGNQNVYNIYNLVAEYSLPYLSLLSSTSYRDVDNAGKTEITFAGAPLLFLNGGQSHYFSQEFRLSSRLTGPWKWSTGLFYRDATEKGFQDARPVLPAVSRNEANSRSYALFAEVTRALAEKFELTLGGRYYKDRIRNEIPSDFFGNVIPGVTTDFSKPTGRVVLAFKPRADRMFYASVASGFRSGINQGAPARAAGIPAVDPDTLVTYEVGSKGALFGKGGYDLSVYYTQWDGIQQSLFTTAGLVAPINGPNANGLGVDASFTISPVRNLFLQASTGWNDLKFTRDVVQKGVVLFAGDSRLNDDPEWTGSVGATYKFAGPIADTRFFVSSSYTYRSDVVVRSLVNAPTPHVVVAQSGILREVISSIGLESDKWSVELFGNNLLNNNSAILPPDSSAAGTSVRLRPRTVGLQGTVKF